MLRYLIKTLLQMNLFTDTIRDATNGTDLFFNISSIPSFNSSMLDWANLTGVNEVKWAQPSLISRVFYSLRV
ncbi:robo3 [Triplophysa rosa]|uniref:Robo3 n=1 Tax=Triplophysa rosa TaxID=992332 RepID=A0A9W7TBM4_TRIRA|nr:robo3 [Triplophysa rosa]